MKANEIKKRLHHYIENANEKKIKAIYAIVEEEIEETYEHWADAGFVNELKEREANYLQSKSQTFTAEEAITQAKKNLQKKKKSV